MIQVIRMGVAIIVLITLFRGDISLTDMIPLCKESEETRFRVRLYSEWDCIPWGHESEGTSFLGDMTVENIPRRSRIERILTSG